MYPCSSQLHVNIIKLEIEREAIRERSNIFLMGINTEYGAIKLDAR